MIGRNTPCAEITSIRHDDFVDDFDHSKCYACESNEPITTRRLSPKCPFSLRWPLGAENAQLLTTDYILLATGY